MKKYKYALLATSIISFFPMHYAYSSVTDDSYSIVSGTIGTNDGLYESSSIMLNRDELMLTQNFRYLEDPKIAEIPAGCETHINDHYISYNNYPFSLPLDDQKINTLYFSSQPKHGPNDVKSSQLIPLIQEKIEQLIFEDFPELKPFHELSKSHNTQGEEEQEYTRKNYSLHFFGEVQEDSLTQVSALLTAWSNNVQGQQTSHSQCTDLDFAIRGMNDATARIRVVQEISNLLANEACRNLETLSLRFMHLSNEDCNTVENALKQHCPSLKRLILSFNDLDDRLCETNGVLAQLLNDELKLPLRQLSIIDLRGNLFQNPTLWGFKDQAERRKSTLGVEKPLNVYFSHNDINQRYFDAAFQQMKSLRDSGVIDFKQDFHENSFLNASDILFFKKAFNKSITGLHQFKSSWIAKNGTFADAADYLLLLKHGKHTNWDKVDLSNAAFKQRDIPVEILRHARNKTIPMRIDLTSLFGESVGQTDELFRVNFINILKSYTQLENLILKGNSFDAESRLYGQTITQMPRLKSFDFSNTGLSKASNMRNGRNSVSGVQHFTEQMTTALRPNNENPASPIRFINFRQNGLRDNEIGSMLKLLTIPSQLSFYDLSDNRFEFVGTSSSVYINDLITSLSSGARKEPPVVLLDLSKNLVSEATKNTIITAYYAKIKTEAAIPWTVLKIDAQSAVKGRTKIQYVSNVKGLVRLARIYENASAAAQAAEWHNVFNVPTKSLIIESNTVYREAAGQHDRELIENALTLASTRVQASPFQLPRLTEITINDRLQLEEEAKHILHKYETIPTESTVIEQHVKILRYIKQNSSGTISDPVKLSIFNGLSAVEKQVRLKEAFRFESKQYKKEGTSNTADTIYEKARTLITTDTILDKAISILFNKSVH